MLARAASMESFNAVKSTLSSLAEGFVADELSKFACNGGVPLELHSPTGMTPPPFLVEACKLGRCNEAAINWVVSATVLVAALGSQFSGMPSDCPSISVIFLESCG